MLAILHDPDTGQWLRFRDPLAVLAASRRDQVSSLLREVERRVTADRLWAVGCLSYEAAPAFDAALQTWDPDTFPLACFGLYSSPCPLQLSPGGALPLSPPEWRPSITAEDYDRAFATVRELIARGETYQVNFSFRLLAAAPHDPWAFFLGLEAAQPAAYGAFLDLGRYAICSASPELFFRLDGDRITARPMKGTAPRGKTLAEDLVQARWLRRSEKNRAENLMIVDMVRNDVGRIAATGSVRVSGLFRLERYPTLWQMTSTVTATTRASVTDILAALFPPASVTGAPKARTMAIIAALETRPRHVYTGCIGFLGPQRRAQFSVAIRTVLIDREAQQAEYGVGGGLVWDSTGAEEFAECQTKTRLVTDRRPEFSLLETLLWTPQRGYFLLPYHLRRLRHSAAYFGYPLDRVSVAARLEAVATSLQPTAHRVRLLLDRHGVITCEATPLACLPTPTRPRLRLASHPIDPQDVFVYHKTTNRTVYESAASTCAADEEVLLWNDRSEITETATANVVVRWGGRLYTPPVSSGLLPGTFRAWLLETETVVERALSLDDLHRFDRIYLVNSVRRWRRAVWPCRD